MSTSGPCRDLRHPLFATGLLLAFVTGASAAPPLFNPVAPTPANHAAVAAAGTFDYARRLVALDTTAMQAARKGDVLSIAAPSGEVYAVTYERTDDVYAGGQVWIGHLDDIGHSYPVVISTYEGRVSGSISTPWGTLRLHGAEQAAVLTDTALAGERAFESTIDDSVPIPPEAPQALAPSSVLAAAGSIAQIDLLLLFTPSLQSKLGGYAQTIARLNQLVGVANTAYQGSGVSVSLNLVSAQPYSAAYVDQDDSTALPALRTDPTVAAMRQRYGADLVTLARPFVGSICGLGYLPGSYPGNGSGGFSVFEDGQIPAPGGGYYYCLDVTMTHELGHNMGSAHDAGTTISGKAPPPPAAGTGTPSYNRGYCNGSAGTLMAYSSTPGCNPIVAKFSNPAISTCGGGVCGKASGSTYSFSYTDNNNLTQTSTATGADNASGINGNAPSMANWYSPRTGFTSLPPARLLDTRAGYQTFDGAYAGTGALGSGESRDLLVVGRGGVPNNVPDSAVGSVILNVTVASPTAAGFVTVWPAGNAQPTASNLNFTPGQIIPNLVVAKIGTNGKVSMFNSAGSTPVVADVAGWFPASSGFSALTPARLLDTRPGYPTSDSQFAGGGALGPGGELDLTVLNRGGVPASGVAAVILNVTVTDPTAAGFITAWPAGNAQPATSNLNFTPGQTIPNLVVSRVGSSGKVALYNSTGSTHLIADVAGWFASSSELVSVGPARLLDTRPGYSTSDGQFAGGGALGPAATLSLQVTGRANIPSSGVDTVILNVTAVTPTGPGYLSVWGAGDAQPNTSNLNFTSGLIIPNLVFAKVGSNGQVSIFNSVGSTHVVADVVGWFASSP
jgi:hypothetical protein